MISKKTEELISEIEKFSESKLKCMNDIGILIELSEINKSSILFSDVMFTAKFICGLKSVLLKKTNTAEVKKNLLKEYRTNLDIIIKKIKSILETSDEGIKDMFEKKYFGNDEISLHNLIDIIDELGICKNYYNSIRD
jgi:hypothetical protein